MIEIKMPKEINKYEAKAVGPFTLRQLICLFICLPLCVGTFLLLNPYIGPDIAGFFVLPIAGVGYLFGWYKPYGMRFEKYLQTMFICSFLAPTKRLYKTENYYSGLLNEIRKEEIAADLAVNDGKKKKSKKYRRFKDAIL